jgi:hypothetical protein
MGIQKREGTGGKAVFIKINAKEGAFQQGSKENKVTLEPMTQVVGTLIGFKIDEGTTLDNVKKEELRLILADPTPGEPNMHVSVGLTTAEDANTMGLKILGLLNAADVTKPIAIMPWKIKEGEKLGDDIAKKDLTGVTIYQDGKKLVTDFGDGVTALPKLQPVMNGGKPLIVKGKEVLDKGPWNAMIDPLLDKLHARLHPDASEAENEDEVDAAQAAALAEAKQQQGTAAPAAEAANRSSTRQRA